MNTFGVSGKHCLITGPSAGLGLHFSKFLARLGVTVTLASRRVDLLTEISQEIRREGGTAHAVAMDVRDSVSVERAAEKARDLAGPVDVLINNAAVIYEGTLIEQPERLWDDVIDTNLKGAYLVSKSIAIQMKEAGRGGSIINIASVLGIGQSERLGPYCVSKSALIHLTKMFAVELAKDKIRVNAIAPGYIYTARNSKFWETIDGKALEARIPQGHPGTPEDLDGTLLLLASDLSRFTTGSVIVVDGGHLVRSL